MVPRARDRGREGLQRGSVGEHLGDENTLYPTDEENTIL